jgi:hypothetical protein
MSRTEQAQLAQKHYGNRNIDPKLKAWLLKHSESIHRETGLGVGTTVGNTADKMDFPATKAGQAAAELSAETSLSFLPLGEVVGAVVGLLPKAAQELTQGFLLGFGASNSAIGVGTGAAGKDLSGKELSGRERFSQILSGALGFGQLLYGLWAGRAPGTGPAVAPESEGTSGSPANAADPVNAATTKPTSPAQNTISPTVGELRSAKLTDAHHIVQEAAVRDVPGYKTRQAPGLQLEGPSNKVGTPHYEATQVQNTAGIGGSYGAERQVAAMAMTAAGFSPEGVAAGVARADAYFIGRLGLTLDSPLRIPGKRRIP